MDKLYEVLKYFPLHIQNEINKVLIENNCNEEIMEIRIRVKKPIILKCKLDDIILKYIIEVKDILEIFEKICENSVYSYKNQICQGFITIKGGHRVGIVGTIVSENEKIINVKYISSLNFRIAREKIGCSDYILNKIIDYENNTIFNTLIISPPGCGKTTLLRDIVRNISDGIDKFNLKGETVGIVDERGEIAANLKGIPQNNIGIRTDIIENVTKYDGIKILIRTMAPQIIACDEIGTKKDIEAINYAITSGVKGIFTAHANSIKDLEKNEEILKLINEKIIEKIILLDKNNMGNIKEIYSINNEKHEYYLEV